MQLILLVETRASCESDYRYIKSVIDYYYVERSFKLSKIFAKTKSELIKLEPRIASLKDRYNGESVVVVCADVDRKGERLNKTIEEYCNKHEYELVWMNLDVEEVFWGRVVPNHQKNQESIRFLSRKHLLIPTLDTLSIENPLQKHPASNLLVVLDRYLKRKS